MRLAVITTHPIQYHAPLFRQLAERGVLDIRVFYGWEGASTSAAHDPGFGQTVQWDLPLLDGYEHEFVHNAASDPGSHHFGGINNPDLVPRVLAWRADVVLIFGWNYLSHLRALRAFHGRVPVLFRGDSTLLNEVPGPRRWTRRAWLRWVYRHVDLALYVGQHNRAYFRAHGVAESALRWGPHAVDNDRFSDPEHDAVAAAWRGALGIPVDAPTVLFAGKLESNKAPDVLLDAFLRLDASLDVRLIFVGSGPLEADLRTRARKSPHVHFLGFQNQSAMPAAYRLGDILVLPSQSETWGLTVNEAFASGRPAIVSDHVGCAPDLITSLTGMTFATGDVPALEHVLTKVLGERLKLMGEAAQRHINSWRFEILARSIEEAVYQVATR